jgi:hypothetical protein
LAATMSLLACTSVGVGSGSLLSDNTPVGPAPTVATPAPCPRVWATVWPSVVRFCR